LKGCFEIIKGQAWISSKGEKKREKKKKEKAANTKPDDCWLHAPPYHEGDVEMISTPPWKAVFGNYMTPHTPLERDKASHALTCASQV
jgi:hypothetical protein